MKVEFLVVELQTLPFNNQSDLSPGTCLLMEAAVQYQYLLLYSYC